LENTYIGLDIGGTKILGALFNEEGQILKKEKTSTRASKGAERIIQKISKVVDALLDSENQEETQVLNAIGLGVPGIIKEGVIQFSPNLPWSNFPLKEYLEKTYNVPVFMGNDANVSLYGEWTYGAAKWSKDVVGFFVGTGIGGALILDGKLYSGNIGAGGEIGHMIIDPLGPYCGCGARGCLEAFASKTAILKEVKNQIFRGRETYLTKFLEEDEYILKSSHLKEALEKKDQLTEEIVFSASQNLGIASASMINIFNPELIVFGGGLIEALGENMLPVIEEFAAKYSIKQNFDSCKFQLSSLADKACLYGALGMIKNRISL